MTDIVVTIPRDRWQEFALAHRDGREAAYTIYGDRPPLGAGDRLYFVSHGRLRCAIDVHAMTWHRGGHLVRGVFLGGLTVADPIKGFPGWLVAPFGRDDLLAFEGWQRDGVTRFASRLAVTVPQAPLPPYAHGKTASEQGGSSA